MCWLNAILFGHWQYQDIQYSLVSIDSSQGCKNDEEYFPCFLNMFLGKPHFPNFRCTSTTWPPPSCMTSRSRPGRDRRSGRRSCTLGGSPTRGKGKSHKKTKKRKLRGNDVLHACSLRFYRRRILLRPGCEAMRTFSPRWENPWLFLPLSPDVVYLR